MAKVKVENLIKIFGRNGDRPLFGITSAIRPCRKDLFLFLP